MSAQNSIPKYKSTFLKTLFFTSLIIFIVGCTQKTTKSNSPIPFIPANTSFVIKGNNLKQIQSHFSNNSLIAENKKNVLVNYFKNIGGFKLLTPKKHDFYLCYSPIGKTDLGYTLITPLKHNLLSAEKIKKYTTGNFTYNNTEYNEVTINEKTFYTTTLDSTWIASDNKLLVENSIRQYQNKPKNKSTNPYTESFKVLEANNNSFSVVVNNKNNLDIIQRLFPNYDTSTFETKNWSGWTAGDFKVDSNTITFDGVYRAKDSIYDFMNLFNNTRAQSNQLAKITPANFKSFTSYTYDNYSQLNTNITQYNHKDADLKNDVLDDFLTETDEFGVIRLSNEKALAFSLIDETLDVPSYLPTEENNEAFRDFTISKLEESINFNEKLAPLIQNFNDANYYIQITNFVVFANDKNVLKDIITASKNEDVLPSKNWYTNFSDQIANQSSILHLQNTKSLIPKLALNVAETYTESWKKTNNADYKLAAIQCTTDNNFTHIHQVISKSESKRSDFIKVGQTASTVLENNISGTPQFVKNHLTKGMDVIAQDQNNELTLINNTGKILWQKEIGAPILGKIQQIDMYRNGRLQLIFTTPNKLHVLDRNGNNVAPFPLTFTSTITQPVAVFDYDKKRKYRIAVVLNDKIKMFDNKGQSVKGFRFKNNAKGRITHPPKHIKVGSKDYIVVNESNTGVHFLSRTGKKRIKIKSGGTTETTNEWYWYNNSFASLTADLKLTQITTSGKLSKTNPPIGIENTQIDATLKTWVSFAENTLSIKNKKIDLEFGVYSKPKIFYLNNKVYVSITDTQTSKIYLFDSNAKPINGFPIYGNSLIDMKNADKDNALEIITIGEKNSLLFYEMN
ncbi:hypothetical protein [Aquimarina agarilytica]|uniref:hypothetical protein n=1 Tax=Aquimarina agarilytica TaxID=1087449 RepID=UPI0002889CD9|nr:hypothetical protein [Aquimarina agarilytica]